MADRQAPEPVDRQDVCPVVRTADTGNLGLYVFLAILLLGGVWIVTAMTGARQDAAAPRTTLPGSASQPRIAQSAAPALPTRFTDGSAADSRRDLRPAPQPARAVVLARPDIAAPAPRQPPAPYTPPRAYAPSEPTYAPPTPGELARNPGFTAPRQSAEEPPAPSGERVRAGRLANPSLTVPLGTVIPAVLETALDSTRPGSVRALIQRDVHGFDGTRVLIPRGSRVYGEYASELQPGQNRALVTWTRLLRPDGVTVALDSSASDPLGRAGIRGRVDGKFLQRFGDAILQTVLDIGVGIATRRASDGVIVALPGATQSAARSDRREVAPTLKVRHGTSVSVYVARDLDFSGVDS